MDITLKHTFRLTGPWENLLKDVDNLEKFIQRIEKYCDSDPTPIEQLFDWD